MGKVTSVAPPSTQPLTLDKLMAGIVQPEGSMVPVIDSPKAHAPPTVQTEQPKALPSELNQPVDASLLNPPERIPDGAASAINCSDQLCDPPSPDYDL